MKVDFKIVPVEVEEKSGWFRKKTKIRQRLQYFIHLTDVEQAIIKRAGLMDFSYHDMNQEGVDITLTSPISNWVDRQYTNPQILDFDTVFEAQTDMQLIKRNLATLKEAMDAHMNNPTEDSFEL
jgi:hypothetical protein